MNDLYKELAGEHWMVHFPYFGATEDSLMDGQANLTKKCIAHFPKIEGNRLLEIGCGNGVQSLYVKENYSPAEVTGLDFNPENVVLAREIASDRCHTNVGFVYGDAQKMTAIADASYDHVLNVESAFHYPDKNAFFGEIFRVLKPGGTYVIADILLKPNRRHVLLRLWERLLSQNYWPADLYRRGLLSAGLSINTEEDITDPVIRGFGTHRGWLRRHHLRGAHRRLLVNIFLKLQVLRHVYYMRNVCSYHIFAGEKPALGT